MRKAEIAIVNFLSKKGTEDMYCVYLYENDELKEVRPLEGKSIYYAQDVAENWENGLIKLEND